MMHYACGASMNSRISLSLYYIRPDGRPWKMLYHKNLLTMFVCLELFVRFPDWTGQKNNVYHTSAIASSLVETATLPLRYDILLEACSKHVT